MGKANELTIDVKANLNIPRETAETCLKLVEIFCNDNGVLIRGHRNRGGYITFEYEEQNKKKVSQEALDALKAIGRETHPGE